MQVGDLVFVHGRVEQYVITVPGSWGYVVKVTEDSKGVGVTVNFEHYGERSDRREFELQSYTLYAEDLRVLPNPPETPDEITELVRLLTKLTA